MDERRIGIGEIGRTLGRIEGRVIRIEAALFDERGLVGRTAVNERRLEAIETRQAADDNERRWNRIMAAGATFIGSAIGAALGFLGGGQHK